MSMPNDDLAATSRAADQSKEQKALARSLRRISGLVQAIYAISETNANENIKSDALGGIYDALEKEIGELLDAEDLGKIIAVAGSAA